jgi:hypothetical protein
VFFSLRLHIKEVRADLNQRLVGLGA